MGTTPWTWTDAICFNVVDGDTLDLQLHLDVGFGARTTHRVRGRLNRIDAPKVSTQAGQDARDFLLTELHAGSPLLTVVTVEPYKFGGPQWSPGQWMVEVTLPNGQNVSDLLVHAGHAVHWDGSGPRPNTRDGGLTMGDVSDFAELLPQLWGPHQSDDGILTSADAVLRLARDTLKETNS